MARKKAEAAAAETRPTPLPVPPEAEDNPIPDLDDWQPDDIATIPPDPTTADYDSESLQLIAAHCHKIAMARDRAVDASERAKATKKALEHLQEELEGLIKQRTEELPLFDKPKPKPVSIEASAVGGGDWWGEPVAILAAHGLPASTIAALVEAKIDTIGDIASWTNAGKRLEDIPGIGPAKADSLKDALDGFWDDQDAALAAAREATEADDEEADA